MFFADCIEFPKAAFLVLLIVVLGYVIVHVISLFVHPVVLGVIVILLAIIEKALLTYIT